MLFYLNILEKAGFEYGEGLKWYQIDPGKVRNEWFNRYPPHTLKKWILI